MRAGNVIGGGDWQQDRLIPDSIKSLERDRPIKIRNPHALRPWQHVLDPLNGYLLLASRMYEEPHKFFGAWNFGPDHDSQISVSEVVDKVIAFIAPIIIGGKEAKTAAEGEGVDKVVDSLRLERISIERLGEDLMVCGYVVSGKRDG